MLRKRGKKGIVVAIGFAALALTSVGFSTWIMGVQSQTDNINVTVEVADVLQNDTITGVLTDSSFDGAFKFDAAKGDTTGPIVATEDAAEDLNISFTVQMQNNGTFNGLTLDATCDKEFNSFINNKYIISPFRTGETLTLMNSNKDCLGNENIIVTFDENNYTCKVDITFGWGEYFKFKNPSYYPDGYDEGVTVDSIFEALNTLKTLDNAKLNFVVTHPGTAITTGLS